MLGRPPMMYQATIGLEALSPETPDPPILTWEDIPSLSDTNKSITNSNTNMKTFRNENFTKYLQINFGKNLTTEINPFVV